MPVSASSIDPLSWVIRVAHERPEGDIFDLWRAPYSYPYMREAFHETVHFWYSFSSQKGIELSFDCLKSMNVLRLAARKGIDLRELNTDFEMDGYRPFHQFFAFQEIDPNSALDLACVHLYEGVARYWDTVLGGPVHDESEFRNIIGSDHPVYARAYQMAYEHIGASSFLLFPSLVYLAMNHERPLLWFVGTLNSIAENPIKVPEVFSTENLFTAFKLLWDSGNMFSLPIGPLSTYNLEYKRYRRWKETYAGVINEDFPIGGHPILDGYASNMLWLAEQKGYHTTERKESCIFPEFAMVGHNNFKEVLLKYFFPPFIIFNKGQTITNPPPMFQQDIQSFMMGMNRFSAFMSITFSLINRQRGVRLSNQCPNKDCPVHSLSLCNGVLNYPEDYLNCQIRENLSHEFGIS